MLNIFNLFLFLLLIWSVLMFSSGKISLIYLIFGIISSSLVALAAFKTKMLQKNTEMLFLSLGFYRHFIKIYVKNALKSVFFLIKLAFGKKMIRPLIYQIDIDYQQKFNPALMVATINFSCGLLCLEIKENSFLLHAIDEKYFREFDLYKIKKNLPQINDDNLV